jgi:Glycosyl hydrolase family 26
MAVAIFGRLALRHLDRIRLAVALAGSAVMAALLVALAGCASAGVLAGSAGARNVALGAYIPDVGEHPARIDRYARLMGRSPVIVSSYKQWDSAPFVRAELRAVWSRGAIPMITWEPMSYHGRHYPLRGIARGRYDRYVRKAAEAAASWGRPVFLRFAHEMNESWYPWGPGIDGNTAHRYKVAWRRVVRIFRRTGADNVRWVWTPYANRLGGSPFERFYPGDRWVDWVGFDGFNWGYGGRSYSFGQVFGRTYRVLARLSSRPMIVAETGAYDRGKAHWISQALRRQLPRLGRIKALVWFNHPVNGVDLRFNSSRHAIRAFRSAARAARYRTTRRHLLHVAGR